MDINYIFIYVYIYIYIYIYLFIHFHIYKFIYICFTAITDTVEYSRNRRGVGLGQLRAPKLFRSCEGPLEVTKSQGFCIFWSNKSNCGPILLKSLDPRVSLLCQ